MLAPSSKWAPLALRVMLGVTLLFAALNLAYGVSQSKVVNPAQFMNAVQNMAGSYLPGFFVTVYGYVIPYLELVVGVLLLLGLFTRAAGVVAVLMFASYIIGVGVATDAVPFLMDPSGGPIPNGDFAYLAAALALAFTGGGAWSLDHKMGR